MTDREKLIELVGVVLTDALMEEECYPWIDDSPQTKGFVQPTSVAVDGKIYFYARYGDNLPTHWMPLPEPPKEEQPCHAVNCAAVRCRKPSP